jgi:hypothetical protein
MYFSVDTQWHVISNDLHYDIAKNMCVGGRGGGGWGDMAVNAGRNSSPDNFSFCTHVGGVLLYMTTAVAVLSLVDHDLRFIPHSLAWE